MALAVQWLASLKTNARTSTSAESGSIVSGAGHQRPVHAIPVRLFTHNRDESTFSVQRPATPSVWEGIPASSSTSCAGARGRSIAVTGGTTRGDRQWLRVASFPLLVCLRSTAGRVHVWPSLLMLPLAELHTPRQGKDVLWPHPEYTETVHAVGVYNTRTECSTLTAAWGLPR
jgi:hypothetical protein